MKKEVKYAIYKIGKNKAPSYDGLMDIIFQKRMYKRIYLNGYKPNQLENCSKQDIQNHENEIIEELADKLTLYLNFCIKEKTRLLYN